jgi:N-acetylmuramoyl-L-alanine amidase
MRGLATVFVAMALAAGLPAAQAAAPGNAVPKLPASAKKFPVATAVRIGGDSHDTRFVMDFTKKVDVATFTLADPYRVVIDMPQVVFTLPGDSGEHGHGLIKAFRYGLIMEGGSRIVLDVTQPVKVDKAFALAAADGQPARLVLELTPTDRQSYLHIMEMQNSATPEIPVQASAAPANANDKRPLIVLDPGHGGIDSGTKSYNGKVDEKNIVLAFGLRLRELLEKTGRYRVAMTRSTDVFIPLEERVRFARSHHAALFISIHADMLPRSEGRTSGATVYTVSKKASDAAAARVAAAENKSDMLAGVDLSTQPNDVASILFDLAQRETKIFSVQFAHDLVGSLTGVAPLHDPAIKSAAFVVLKDPDVPSVLVELGYLSSPADVKNLTSPAWRAHTAAALVKAINTYFAPRLAGVGKVP